MPKRKKKMTSAQEESFFEINDTVSAGECTGLIPAGIHDENEAESYAELYSIHKQKTTQE